MMANKCPYDDGIAVYQARSALYQLGYPLISNDCESTLPAQGNQKRLRKTENAGVKDFTIYPNPAKEQVNLRYEVKDEQEIYFELHDIVGKKVMRKRLTSNFIHTLNLKQMHHGIYLFRLINENEILQSGKLVIE